MDLLHALHPKLLIEREGYSFEVLVSYENIPKFCSHCHFIGHLVGECNSLRRIQQITTKTSLSKEAHTLKPPKKAQFALAIDATVVSKQNDHNHVQLQANVIKPKVTHNNDTPHQVSARPPLHPLHSTGHI